jgi:hypothetical protein
MELTVEITSAALLPSLIDAFRRNGCEADRCAETSCRVVHRGHDETEARLEVAFFVRAWQLRHPDVEATVC